MNRLDASDSAEPIIRAAVNDLFDPDLAHRRSAHQARLDRDVEHDALERCLPDFAPCRRVVPCCGEDVFGLRRVRPHQSRRLIARPFWEQMPECVKLGVECSVAAFVRAVATASDNLAVVHEHAADRNFAGMERFLALIACTLSACLSPSMRARCADAGEGSP